MQTGSEKPLLLSLLCKFNGKAQGVSPFGGLRLRPSRAGQLPFCSTNPGVHILGELPFGNQTEMGSLAGAAYLLNNNAGVLRRAQ